MREEHYNQLYRIVERYGKLLIENNKSSKVMDFARPIPGYQDVRGMRLFLLPVDGKKALLMLKHNGEAVNAKGIKDEALERELIIAAQTRAAMNERSFKMLNPGVEEVRKRLFTDEVKEVCPGFYSVRYDDGSMSLVNSIGGEIKSPIGNYDVIQDFRYLGELHGVPHFAIKGQDWATRNYESELIMFDINGHQKLFHDPRVYPKTLDEIQAAFDKVIKASQDLNNPRRNDPMLTDLDLGRGAKIHR